MLLYLEFKHTQKKSLIHFKNSEASKIQLVGFNQRLVFQFANVPIIKQRNFLIIRLFPRSGIQGYQHMHRDIQ